MKNKNYRCQIETITPIHVGSGKLYRRGIDFDLQKDQLLLYDAFKIHARLAEAGKTAITKYESELLSEKPSLQKFFRSVGWKDDEFLRHRLAVSVRFVRDVKGQMKTGLGVPIIPGSSLKGALRTAMLSDYFDEHSEQKEPLFRLRNPEKLKADRRIVQAVFGNDPNHDVMRQVSVSDIEFKKNALSLVEMKIANLTNNGYGFLNMFKKQNEHPDNWKRATSIVAEVLDAGLRSQPFELTFDGFLEEHHASIFGSRKIPLKGKFWGVVDWHFQEMAEREYNFFERFGLEKTARFYEQNILNRKFEDSEILIRVGWGGGWKFMTGDWLSDQQLEQARRQYRLGKKGHPVFPKSRRLIIQENFPQIPLGWAVLHLLPSEERSDEESNTTSLSF